MSFLVDTDTCSAHFKGNARVTGRFLQYMGQLNVSVVTLGELFTWALRAKASPKRLQDINDLLNDVTVLNIAVDVSHKYGEVRAKLLDRGLPAPNMDLLNASIALVHNLTLVTHNTVDYQNITGLRLEDWMVP